MQFIDLKRQFNVIKDEINTNIQKVLHHGQFILGPEVRKLEEVLANYVGVKHCIGMGSGTDALQIALMALDIGTGDEVITTPFTFIATAAVIQLLGAKPVFVDIDPDTYNINPNVIEKALTPKTKAILSVDLFGQCVDYEAIQRIATQHAIPIIADCAQSFGAEYKHKKAGSYGDIACTSFYPAKPLGAYGEAGACFTDNPTLAKKMYLLRHHGQSQTYQHDCLGMNGRLDTLQAAILLAKFTIFAEELITRQAVAKKYNQLLRDSVKIPLIAENNMSAYAQYTILYEHRDALRNYLHQHGIPTAVHYPRPLHLQPALAYLNYKKGDFPVAEKIAQQVLSLPMHPYLEDEEIMRISQCIRIFTQEQSILPTQS